MKLNKFSRLKWMVLKILAGGLSLLVLFLVGMHYLPMQDFTISEETVTEVIQPAVQKQQKIESEIQTYSQGGSYSFNAPLVIPNPYGTAPLTALLIFDTPQDLQISLHVPGKTPQAAIDFTFADFCKHHEIPVYGLYADYSNQVILSAKNQAGEITQTMVELKTEPLPVYLDSPKIIRVNPEFYSPGMNFTFRDNKLVFDINGEVRWFSTHSSFQTFARLANGHYLFTYLVSGEPNDVVMEQDLLGKIYAIYNVPNGVHHDFAELPNGNLLVTTENAASYQKKDTFVELDRENGQIVHNFDMKNYLDENRPAEIDFAPGDWLHMNSIVYDVSDQSIIFSSRAQSAVIKMTYPEMKIQWILGPHDSWKAQYQPFLLTPIGEPFEWQWSQHAANILAEENVNGNQLIDLLLFDNGNYRSFDLETALSAGDSYSRIVRYRINETNRTVEQVWEYGKERGSEIFSTSRGSAYRLENGNYLGNWAEILRDSQGRAVLSNANSASTFSKIIEVNPANNQVVFEADMASAANYRTFRASLYSGYSQHDSILSAKINQTTAMDLNKQIITALQPVKRELDRGEIWLIGAAKKALRWIGIQG